jgi:D-serine deaminase-like pyridoxal phosphate-dependent protein
VQQEALDRLLAEPIDWRYKGFPETAESVPLGRVGAMGWNLLAGDLALPVMVLKEGALRHNAALMARWCREHGVFLCPHGKTTMAPQLFKRQLEAGAWGMTAATVSQVRVYRAFGVGRVLLANEVVEPVALRWLGAELAQDPAFDFYCLVDSREGVSAMGDALVGSDLERPVQVLLEVGYEGGRTGCRTEAEALELARAIGASPVLELAGVEGYEGLIGADRSDATMLKVDEFLGRLRETAVALERSGAFAERGRILVSAGGSAYFDRVVELLGSAWELERQVDVVIRCGCYLTHDSDVYERVSPLAGSGGDAFQPAIEIWGSVLSRPEPELAIVGFGKRDVSHDLELPLPQLIRGHSGLRSANGTLTVTALNDQHAFVRVESGEELGVGDLVGCGISHPCTAFDKWRLIPVVDDDYAIVDAVRTFF